MFKKIDADEALIYEKGVYKPTEVYEGPDGGLYVKAKGGFVRVKANGSTSHADTKLQLLQREGDLYQDRFGRLCLTDGEGRREVYLDFDGEKVVMRVADVAGGAARKLEKK